MKAIMISVKPEWVCKILNGEKTLEIRKTKPKCALPINVYIYCTKDKKKCLWKMVNENEFFEKTSLEHLSDDDVCLNGKVVAKFTLNYVERVSPKYNHNLSDLEKKSCVSRNEMQYYAKNKPFIYAWPIYLLEIFDKPKELSEFNKCDGFLDCINCKQFATSNNATKCNRRLKKAPQSWCYIEVEE